MKSLFRGSFLLMILFSAQLCFPLFCDFSQGQDINELYRDLKDEPLVSAVKEEAKIGIPKKEEALRAKESLAASQELISVNFENSDIAEVVRVLSEKSGLNIVLGPDVKATVNLQLTEVAWEKALDVILRTYNLTYKKEAGLIRVMTLEQLKLEEEKVPLATKILTLNFGRVENVKTSFNSMLSARGKIEIDARTNSLIITDLPENITKIESIVTQLDTRTPQVMIEAMMADVKLVNEDQLGIQWKWARNENRASGARSAKTVVEQGSSLLPSSTALDIVFGQTILKYVDFTATLRLWQEQKRVNILAHPIIMTLDNQSAHIELTEQIPYQQQTTSTESSSAVSTTSFKEAGIKLDVTPHITTKDNYISMNLKVEQSFLSGYTADTQPIIDGRKAETNLLVKDGETIVIGGLRKKEDTLTVDKVPFLGDIPLFGVLFRKKIRSVTDIDLLIFVTPRIVVDADLTGKEQARLKLFAPSAEEEKIESSGGKKRKSIKPKDSKEKLKKEEVFTLRPPS